MTDSDAYIKYQSYDSANMIDFIFRCLISEFSKNA